MNYVIRHGGNANVTQAYGFGSVLLPARGSRTVPVLDARLIAARDSGLITITPDTAVIQSLTDEGGLSALLYSLAASSDLITTKVSVDASAGGTAQTAAIVTMPKDSIFIDATATVVTPFDGSSTTTLEVGVSGNTDAYIDPVDFDPGAAAGTIKHAIGGTNNDIKVLTANITAAAVIATWTNTGTPGAGEVEVAVTYLNAGKDVLATFLEQIANRIGDIETRLNRAAA